MNMFIEEMDIQRYPYENSPIGVPSNVYKSKQRRIEAMQGKILIAVLKSGHKRPIFYQKGFTVWTEEISNACVYLNAEDASKDFDRLAFHRPRLCKVYAGYVEILT